MERDRLLRSDLSNILEKWNRVLDEPETDVNRDAAILRFELAFEVGWKLIKALAEQEGYEVKSPRQAFEQAFTLGWVTDEVIWTDILKARNKATHVYREAYAKSLYEDLDSFYQAFKELQQGIDNI